MATSGARLSAIAVVRSHFESVGAEFSRVDGLAGNRASRSFPRGTFLFGDDFHCAYGWVIDSGSEVDLNSALRRGFNVLEGFDQGFGPSFPEDIKSLQKHRSVTRDIEHTASHTSNAAILDAKPMLHKVQFQSVFAARRNNHYEMKLPNTMPSQKPTLCD